MELRPNSRTFSTLNKMTQFPSNKTIHSFISKQINLDKELEPKEKRYYLNLSHRNAYNSFSKSLKNKKLFYNRIYNRNLRNIDSLGLAKFIKIKREKIRSPMREKDFSSTRISSTNTHRRINIRPKINQKTKENENKNKSSEFSYDKDKTNFKIDSYYFYNNKRDVNCDINNDEFIQIFNKIKKKKNDSKKNLLSVSSLLINKEKYIENNIDNTIDVNS